MNLPDEYSLKFAHQIAQAAACLDDLHAAPVDGATYWQSRKAAVAHIENLHNIAIFLAGNKADEVYAPDDSDQLSVQQAAGVCVCTNS
jgi:hypothetical protein